MSDDRRLRYSTDKSQIVKQARARGLSDEEILKSLTANEYGERARVHIVREWADALGLEPSEALQKARRAGIIG